MKPKDLCRLDESIGMLYLEHCKISKKGNAIVGFIAEGIIEIPIVKISCLVLGPGTSISHSAISEISNANCMVIWAGEDILKFYSYGINANDATRFIKQLELFANPSSRNRIALNMYNFRFKENLEGTEIARLRGMEGMRVRKIYSEMALKYNVKWDGRKYDPNALASQNSINKALTMAHQYLYALCRAAILIGGYSPAIGFIHYGTMSAFVYDVADLYKTEVSIPIAFKTVSEIKNDTELYKSLRFNFRQSIDNIKFMKNIIDDIQKVLI